MKKQIKHLDVLFSKFVRLRDADSDGLVRCCTCGKVDHWKKRQCGHFMSRRHLATRWEEKNTGSQCVSCNIFKQGEQVEFAKYLDKRYGEGTAEAMRIKSRNRFDKAMVTILIKQYENKINNIR